VYLLTGTPLTNRPRDLFVLLHAIRALALDIGFYRKVCRNGLIAPDTIVQFKFAHQQRDLGTEIRFEVARERLQELQGKFSEQFAALKKCRIPRAAFAPMVRVALMMRPLKETRPGTREAEDWRALDVHITERCNRYASELGETAYALLNTVTDLASHPPENRHLRRDRHSLQRLAGTWLTTFSNECRQRGFAIDRFIARMKAL
jgi:hypothetical protein